MDRRREPLSVGQLRALRFDGSEQRRRRRRQFRRRRSVAGLIVGSLVVGSVYLVVGLASPSRKGSVAIGTGPGRKKTVSVPTTALPPPREEPGGGRTLLPNRRIVAFYGAAGNPRLGVLGDAEPEQLWSRLVTQAAPYDQPATPVLPAYELIAYTTQKAPGPDNSYASRVPDETIDKYLAAVRAHHGLLILDIQPGRTDFLADAVSLAHWLDEPDVGLALDPEWKLDADQFPSKQIGHTTADAVNAVSAWLAQMVASQNLPQKLLLIHQFTQDMVSDKPSLQQPAGLAMVFNMDGFGAQPAKLSRYQDLATDPRFALGFKVFYHQDRVPFTPAGLLALTPPPLVVEYE